MKKLATLIFILKSVFWGGLFGLTFLFFVPDSKLPFNWQVAQDMFEFYQNEKAFRKNHENRDHLTVESFSLSSAVEKASPSVVSINVLRRRLRRDSRLAPNQGVLDTAFRIGSGVIMSDEGHIVTNYHVIGKADLISVNFANGRRKTVELVGYDIATDLAVLKVDLTNLRPAELGDSRALKAGDLVMAIGSPFGGNQSVSMGIVSAIALNPFPPKIQTDASINQGNSGGALINTEGKVIGINQIKISSKGGGQTGINYAIPIDQVKKVVEQIIEHGEVRRNWLGIVAGQYSEVNHRTEFPEIPFGTGFVVNGVEKGSPAEKVGIVQGDFVIGFAGKKISGISDFHNLFYSTSVGAEVEIEFIRDGETIKKTLKLVELNKPLNSNQQ